MKYFFALIACWIFSFSIQAQTPGLRISHLTGNFYVYTTYHLIDGKPFPANGMYLITTDGVVMIDTPWDPEQTIHLLEAIERRHQKKVVLCVVTHSHADRTAGLEVLREEGVKTYSSKLTWELCQQDSEKQAEYFFTKDTVFTVGGMSFQTYYPGEGHTKDNIVIWFPQDKILYGGCLVKSTEATSMGNVDDASISKWPLSIKKLMTKFPKPAYIIPGHQSWTSTNSLQHTLKLLQEY